MSLAAVPAETLCAGYRPRVSTGNTKTAPDLFLPYPVSPNAAREGLGPQCSYLLATGSIHLQFPNFAYYKR